MILSRNYQSHTLCIKRERARAKQWWTSFFFVNVCFTTQTKPRECCVYLQCFTQWCRSSVLEIINYLHDMSQTDIWRIIRYPYTLVSVQWVMNSISTIQTMLLPPLFLFHSLQIQFHPQVHKKTQSLEHIWFSSSNHSNWALSATSLPSVRHSRMLLLHLPSNFLSRFWCVKMWTGSLFLSASVGLTFKIDFGEWLIWLEGLKQRRYSLLPEKAICVF